MPIRVENRHPYSLAASEFLGSAVVDAADQLCAAIGYDPLFAPKLWEHAIARWIDGGVTGHCCQHDVELAGIEIEVKFSRQFEMVFSTGSRPVFRWTGLRGSGRRAKTASVTVLVGLDSDRMVHTWVLPLSAIGTTRTATTNIPGNEVLSPRSGLRNYHTPVDQLLAAILRLHNETAYRTRRSGRAAGDLFETTP